MMGINELLQKYYSGELRADINDKNFMNEDGELVSLKMDEDGNLCIAVSQANGWNKINIYYMDGTIEELYNKGK